MPDTDDRPLLRRLGDPRAAVIAAAALLALGGGAGAIAVRAMRPSVTMAPVIPVTIRSLPSSGIVTIRGRIAEVYGNKFVMADPTGRALVDTGREGEGGGLVTAGEPVTVQGRSEAGFVRAAFLIGPDGKTIALGSLGGPSHEPHGPPRGPEDGHGGPPPPRPDAGPAGAPLSPTAQAPGSAAAPAAR